MSNTISIGVATPEATIEINTDPVLASNITPKLQPGAAFAPYPDNDVLIAPQETSFSTEINSYQESAIGGIAYQQNVNINVGESISSLVPELLTAYVYRFDDFIVPNHAQFTKGDLVFIKQDYGVNSYNSSLQKVKITSLDGGAKSSLFIFMSYDTVSRDLVVMHKGYFEVPLSNISSWSSGSTIYPDNFSKFATNPTTTSGNWIRSLGFCIPNNQNKKFIWFEPDTTYLKLL